MDPPARAAVFCFDEKTQCQALDRTQPSLPMFAAMNIATGEVLTDLRKGHAGADVLRFFKQIEATVPDDLDVHVILDNLSAHSHTRDREVVGTQGSSSLAPSFHADIEFLA